MAEAYRPEEIGGDHFRSSAVFPHPDPPPSAQGSDVHVGVSLDQLYAEALSGNGTPPHSLSAAMHRECGPGAGGCLYGYSCVYTDSVSWASPYGAPPPLIRDPRVVFEQLFGSGATPEERQIRLQEDGSILDWIGGEVSRLVRDLGVSDRRRMEQYLEECAGDRAEGCSGWWSGTPAARSVSSPRHPLASPDSFEEHVKLMFDLQVLAFRADMTRVFTFKMGRDVSHRVYPESGSDKPFHPASHHGGRGGQPPGLRQRSTSTTWECCRTSSRR